MQKIDVLNEQPALHHTLARNCTTRIGLMRRANSGHRPQTWKLFASVHVPAYLSRQDRLESSRPYSVLLTGALAYRAGRSAGADLRFSTAIRGIPPVSPAAANGAQAKSQ